MIPEDPRTNRFEARLIASYSVAGYWIVQRGWKERPDLGVQKIAVVSPLRRQRAESLRESNHFARVLLGRVERRPS